MEIERIINTVMENKKNIEEELEVIDFARRMDVGVDFALVRLRTHKRAILKFAVEEMCRQGLIKAERGSWE